MAAGAGLSAFGLKDTTAGRRALVTRLERRGRVEKGTACGVPPADPARDRRRSTLREGWYWGSQAFAERLAVLGASLLSKATHRHARSTPAYWEHGEAEAWRLPLEGTQQAGWEDGELARLPGSDPVKVAPASEIWEKTTENLTWLAEHLCMRSAANASHQIRRWRAHRGKETRSHDLRYAS